MEKAEEGRLEDRKNEKILSRPGGRFYREDSRELGFPPTTNVFLRAIQLSDFWAFSRRHRELELAPTAKTPQAKNRN